MSLSYRVRIPSNGFIESLIKSISDDNISNDQPKKVYVVKNINFRHILMALKINRDFGDKYYEKEFIVKLREIDSCQNIRNCVFCSNGIEKVKLKGVALYVPRTSKRITRDLSTVQNIYQNIVHKNYEFRKSLSLYLKRLSNEKSSANINCPKFQIISKRDELSDRNHLYSIKVSIKKENKLDKVSIKKECKLDTIHIKNDKNLNENCEYIVDNLHGDNKIAMNIDYTETSKEYELLCQTIANTVLVKSANSDRFDRGSQI